MSSNPTELSPNTENLQVGKGIVSVWLDGDDAYRDLGNCTSATITPDADTLEHFSSREGVKKRDVLITIQQKANVKVTMEEFSAQNLAMMVYGTVDLADPGGPKVEIFGTSQVRGKLKFVGTNDVGPKITFELWNVNFVPTGDLEMISDEWNNMEVTGEVLSAPGVQPIAAKGTYTATVQFTTADTLVIGGKTYTLQDTLTSGDGHVHMGADLAGSLANLVKAINLTGVSGTDYGAGTTINPNVSATSDATHLVLTAKTAGAAGNSITTTDTSTSGAFGGTTLAGGVSGDVNAGKFGYMQITNSQPS